MLISPSSMQLPKRLSQSGHLPCLPSDSIWLLYYLYHACHIFCSLQTKKASIVGLGASRRQPASEAWYILPFQLLTLGTRLGNSSSNGTILASSWRRNR